MTNQQTQLEFSDAPAAGKCHYCGSKVVEYKFGINRGLVAFLHKLAEAGRPVTLDELDLTPGQYTNHALVRHWGLAEMMEPQNETESRKGGKWRLTPEGLAFIRGYTRIPKHAFTMRGRLMRLGGPDVAVTDIDEGYLYRQDYRDQVRAQL